MKTFLFFFIHILLIAYWLIRIYRLKPRGITIVTKPDKQKVIELELVKTKSANTRSFKVSGKRYPYQVSKNSPFNTTKK